MQPITLHKHTVILLCGPTLCGKTTWASNLQEKVIVDVCSSVAMLSSDAYRSKLLDYPAHKHSPDMLSVSKQAFALLFAELEAYTSYPVNTEYVIVDTTGFDEGFRKQVRDVAVKNGYSTVIVTFDYKNGEDYLVGCTTEEERFRVKGHLRKYKQKVLPTIYSKDWNQRIRVANREEPSFSFASSDTSPNTSLYVENNQAVAIIGDSHECVEELQKLVQQVEAKYGSNTLFVHVGDYLDKGLDTAHMAECMMTFMLTGRHTIVQGNHENYAYKRLTGEVSENADIEATAMTSVATLLSNEATANTFKALWLTSVPFVTIDNLGQRKVIVTHAPCTTSALGKFSDWAVRDQRNFRMETRDPLKVRDALKFIYDEADMTHPLHVFGHVNHNSNGLVYKNKVFLDTGAVKGGHLTAMVWLNNEYTFEQVKCAARNGYSLDELPTNLTKSDREVREFNIEDYDLSPQDERLLDNVMKNGIRYISGTMPPAPSSEHGLETIEAALKYYKDRGVEAVTLQPKYMGSRGQLYLFKEDVTKSFFVSRSGWKVNHVEGLDKVAAAEYDRIFGGVLKDADSVVLDGEIYPWRALGKGLIEKEFIPYGKLVQDELNALSEDPWFNSVRLGAEYDAAYRKEHAAKYESALGLYSGDEELSFKAFDLLMIDGEPAEKYATSEGHARVRFELVNEAESQDVYLNDQNFDYVAYSKEFFDRLTVENGMEGVVVKPAYHKDGVTPYMKVRNPEYLRLVYGYDYPLRLESLTRQKNITGKAAAAVREHRMAMEMRTANDDRRKELVVKLIAEIRKESEFDPRL